jgi:hypothetical protein
MNTILLYASPPILQNSSTNTCILSSGETWPPNMERRMRFVQAQEFEVAHIGLVVCPEEPWLAASPGGIVDDRAAGNEVSSDQLTCPIPA